jgi:hypothetical protein
MNNTRGSTPPNPSLDLSKRSTDLNKTLGIVGTPHEESIAKFNPTKTCQIKRNLLGVSENPDEIPEHERKYSEHVQVEQ